jgi:hypothetical protein
MDMYRIWTSDLVLEGGEREIPYIRRNVLDYDFLDKLNYST